MVGDCEKEAWRLDGSWVTRFWIWGKSSASWAVCRWLRRSLTKVGERGARAGFGSAIGIGMIDISDCWINHLSGREVLDSPPSLDLHPPAKSLIPDIARS